MLPPQRRRGDRRHDGRTCDRRAHDRHCLRLIVGVLVLAAARAMIVIIVTVIVLAPIALCRMVTDTPPTPRITIHVDRVILETVSTTISTRPNLIIAAITVRIIFIDRRAAMRARILTRL